MATEAGGEQKASPKATRDRSPAYPFISLKAAVERLAAFDATFGRHPTPAAKVGLAWKMKEKSSQAFQTLAALKSYGLVEYKGASEDRVAMLTDDGRNYLRAQQAEIKATIARACALRPKAISTYWQRWGADRPIDAICLDQLVLKDEFTQSAAQTFLRVYDETVAFAGLRNGDKIAALDAGDEEETDTNSGEREQPPSAAKVGDYVRWESNGVIQFVARRMVGLSPDGAYAFVEGSSSGLPIKEITVVPAPTGLTPPPGMPASAVPTLPPQAIGIKQDTFSLDEGTAVLQWPSQLSEESYEDFESWIQLQLRKIKRSIVQ